MPEAKVTSSRSHEPDVRAKKSAPNAGALQGRESHTRFVTPPAIPSAGGRCSSSSLNRAAVFARPVQGLLPDLLAKAPVPRFFELVDLERSPLGPFPKDLRHHPRPRHQHLIRQPVDRLDRAAIDMPIDRQVRRVQRRVFLTAHFALHDLLSLLLMNSN